MKFDYRPKKHFSKTRALTIKISEVEYEKLIEESKRINKSKAFLIRKGFLNQN
jgi:hypothetical protein